MSLGSSTASRRSTSAACAREFASRGTQPRCAPSRHALCGHCDGRLALLGRALLGVVLASSLLVRSSSPLLARTARFKPAAGVAVGRAVRVLRCGAPHACCAERARRHERKGGFACATPSVPHAPRVHLWPDTTRKGHRRARVCGT